MKPPKHNPKNETRPELWVQFYYVDATFFKLRILIPGRDPEWAVVSERLKDRPMDWSSCCWWTCVSFKDKTLKTQRKLMHEYDFLTECTPAVFVGYL